ncbi:MAG: hydrogenase expression/formation protein HypE [Firmicutes bacterium]|nr:hydrogenase expression/formation protein HypE [Bacillota bacterium]
MTSKIKLADGGGGEATARLIREVFWSRFTDPELRKGNDAAVLEWSSGKTALTTDAFVVTPWKFPGGDIGRLAVSGTVNDLTMSGAEPKFLTAAFIIEEGFETDSLKEIVQSMAETAVEAGVAIVAGDTKVVNRGAVDRIFITTTGIGLVEGEYYPGGEKARPGDQVIITGTVGDHGAAILLARGELGISAELESDVAPLNRMLLPLIRHFKAGVRAMRDPTRGGLAVTLNEIAGQSKVSIILNEAQIPVLPEVRGISALLGLDPLYLANEGKAIIIAAPEIAADLVGQLKRTPLGAKAALIGEVSAENPGLVMLRNQNGGGRVLPMGSGELLPRIC